MEFFGINGWEFVVLVLLAMFIFGPDKLPKAISDGVKMLRNLRDMASNATSDLSRELGTDISLEDLHPKTLLRKHLLSEEDERVLRRPFDDLYRDVRKDLKGVHSELKGVRGDIESVHGDVRSAAGSLRGGSGAKPVSTGGPAELSSPATPVVPQARSARAYDDDAT
jgi:sec-independent protein translocase protein TatB